jgi:kinesin family protein 6/9
MQSDNDGNIRLRNIGELPVTTVDDALNLLFVGDTNRIICETPSNDASSRSHCIFTINVEAKEVGGSKIRRSKVATLPLPSTTLPTHVRSCWLSCLMLLVC